MERFPPLFFHCEQWPGGHPQFAEHVTASGFVALATGEEADQLAS